jgi:hypothetical protein
MFILWHTERGWKYPLDISNGSKCIDTSDCTEHIDLCLPCLLMRVCLSSPVRFITCVRVIVRVIRRRLQTISTPHVKAAPLLLPSSFHHYLFLSFKHQVTYSPSSHYDIRNTPPISSRCQATAAKATTSPASAQTARSIQYLSAELSILF